MSQRNSGYARVRDEHYETPDWVAGVIAMWLHQSVKRIWEPAPGSGRFARRLKTYGFEVATTSCDFLTAPMAPWVDAIVTNPPYGKRGELAEAFIRHALELETPIAAFLLKVDYDSAKTRRDIFRDCPYFAGKIVLLDRIVWFERKGAAGPSENHAWFIWTRTGPRPRDGRPWIAYGLKEPDENLPVL